MGAPESAASWAVSNGCSALPERITLGAHSYRDVYGGCDRDVEVGLSTLAGGHFLYQNNSDGVVIADHAWDFLSSHTLVPEPSAPACALAAVVTLAAPARGRATKP